MCAYLISAAISISALLYATDTVSAARSTKLPVYLKRCKFHVPEEDVGKCLGVAMEDALRTMKNGEPTLAIQPLDPLYVPALNILQGSGPVSISIQHRNLSIFGVSHCKVLRNEFKKIDGTLKGQMNCPKITLDGQYELTGRVLLLPVRGKGRSVIVLEKNDLSFVAHGQHVMKNGTLYERYNKIEFNFNPKKMSMNFENLFGGEGALSRTMNDFLNENWRDLLKELKPSYEAVFETVFKDTVDKVFSRVPVKDILTDYYSGSATNKVQT